MPTAVLLHHSSTPLLLLLGGELVLHEVAHVLDGQLLAEVLHVLQEDQLHGLLRIR